METLEFLHIGVSVCICDLRFYRKLRFVGNHDLQIAVIFAFRIVGTAYLIIAVEPTLKCRKSFPVLFTFQLNSHCFFLPPALTFTLKLLVHRLICALEILNIIIIIVVVVVVVVIIIIITINGTYKAEILIRF